MELGIDTVMWGGSLLISGGVAFGIVKGGMAKYMKEKDHTDMCHTRMTEIYNKMDESNDKTQKAVNELVRAVGRLEGKMNGGF